MVRITSARDERLYTRDEVEDMIARGSTVLIVDGKVLKVDAWRPYHPGGDKAILHMVGRDATDEVNALHSPEARQRMHAFEIGRIEGRWTNFLPPIQGGLFQTLEARKLEQDKLSVLERAAEETDSSNSSGCSSPLFELAEKPSDDPRSRRPKSAVLSHSSSATSLSSMELDEQDSKPTLSHLDARTKQEIDLDLAKYPSLDPASQDEIVRKYRLLHERLTAEGLYQCSYRDYMIEISRYTLLFGLCLLFLQLGWPCTSGLFLGLFWHQLVFTAHDAGHNGITHNYTIDTVIGILISDFLGGLSLGWWKRNHNVHHIVTNSPEHDPDIEHMPFFAISHRFFDSLRSTYYDRVMTYDAFARFTIRYQHYLYYPILAFGRFNLYRLSWEYLLLGQGPRKGPAWWHRWFEIVGQVFFWAWFGYGMTYRGIPTAGGRVAFVMISHMVTMPVHLQITLSHFAMSTADLGVAESFPQRMLRTTMDIDCPAWLDFIHGGLQFQAIHHLYPRMPRHNLRRAQKLVQQFCDEVGIPYALYGFVQGNKEVIGRLEDVGRQASILAECQRSVAGKPLGHHH